MRSHRLRVLITRPLADAQILAARLGERGIACLIEPLMEVRPVADEAVAAALARLDDRIDTVYALLLTSANGARFLAEKLNRRDLPVFAVGAATADAARNAGFSPVETADGDVESLANLVMRRVQPSDGKLLHIAGSVVAGDLSGLLRAAGYEVERLVLYRSEAVASLSEAAIDGFRSADISHVALFSPRTSMIFVDLVNQAELAETMGSVTALCLSPNVADAVSLPFAARWIAATPDQEALLRLLDTPPDPTVAPKPAPGTVLNEPRKRGRRGLKLLLLILAALIVLAAIGAGAAYKAGWFEPFGFGLPSATPIVAEQPDALAARVDALEQELATLRQAKTGGDTSDLERRLAALEHQPASAAAPVDTARIEALDQRAQHMSEEMSALGEKVTQGQVQDQAAAEAAGRKAAFALAVAELSDAVLRGEPYGVPLRTASGLADDGVKPLLEQLTPSAETGVPTIDTLIERFPALARDAKIASLAGAEHGWWATVRRFAAGLVIVRRTDRSPETTDGKLALAETRLRARDLSAALTALKELPDDQAAVFDAWRQDAGYHIAAEQALHALRDSAIGALAR